MNCVTNLYSHQRDAVDKLLQTRVGGLFMEMGTGKTRTAIELVVRRRQRTSRVLWFCPVSLKSTVRAEIRKHTDCASNKVYVFDDNTTQRSVPRDALVHVIGLESISGSDRATLAAHSLIDENTYVIVDESSYIKTHNAKRTLRLTHMARPARYRLILTGTPLTQGVVDLYAQMNFLSEKILGYRSFYSFARNHLEYHPDYPGLIVRTHNVPRLAAKIQPYVYQVTKEECLDLPGKVFETRYFELTDAQNEAYMQAKWEILMQLDQEELTSYTIFRLFTALQQIVCGHWNRRREDGTVEHIEFADNRTRLLLDVLHDIPDSEPVIIWAKYHYNIRQIVAALTERYGAEQVAQFHGRLNEPQREAELARWRAGARFLVATQAAGGHGLNLTEAAYVIFHSNDFKYSTRLQAEDRCHRIGTERKVTYIDLCAASSIDERILRALADKADVVNSFRHEVDAVKAKTDKKPDEELRALVHSL